MPQSYVFPSDLGSKQQGHFMKIQIEPSKVGTAPAETSTVMLFIPGGQQNGPLQWQMVHEYDDVKLTKLGMGAVGAITRAAVGAARIAGQGTINPKVDVLYGNSELRTFQFSFFMAPQSQKEAQDLKQIIKLLRKFSAPEIGTPAFAQGAASAIGSAINTLTGRQGTFGGASGQGSLLDSGFWFIPPAEFLITFHSIINNENTGLNAPVNPYLPRIGRCVLTRVDVDYTVQGDFSTFNDGSPTNLQLTLVFREMRIISQKDVEDGY